MCNLYVHLVGLVTPVVNRVRVGLTSFLYNGEVLDSTRMYRPIKCSDGFFCTLYTTWDVMVILTNVRGTQMSLLAFER